MIVEATIYVFPQSPSPSMTRISGLSLFPVLLQTWILQASLSHPVRVRTPKLSLSLPRLDNTFSRKTRLSGPMFMVTPLGSCHTLETSNPRSLPSDLRPRPCPSGQSGERARRKGRRRPRPTNL